MEPVAAVGEQGKPALDLKKAGIFPIVHGVRSLALREHVQATGTQARIDALVAAGRACRRSFATDLADSLHFLMGLKLKAGLAELDTPACGQRRRAQRPAEQPRARPPEGLPGGRQAVQGHRAQPVPPGAGSRPLCRAWRGPRCARRWLLYHLADEHFAFMYDAPPADEWVALDCETTGLDVRHDQIVSIGAVRIVGNRLLTSERLELLVRPERR